MVFDNIIKAVRDTLAAKNPQAADSPNPKLRLPHPEEPMNPAATISNLDKGVVLEQWFVNWEVPLQYREHWRNTIEIQVYEVYPASIIAMGARQDTPAATWESNGKRYLAVKPQWLNPGVIAHEQAHNSYSYLNPILVKDFAAIYGTLKNSDPLIRMLYSINRYGLSNDIEGHAEVYRYIGQQMPAALKQFYPLLF